MNDFDRLEAAQRIVSGEPDAPDAAERIKALKEASAPGFASEFGSLQEALFIARQKVPNG